MNSEIESRGCNPPKVKGKKKPPTPGAKLKRPFTLAALVKDYLDEVGYNGIEKSVHAQHEDYLESLENMTDWICGQKNGKKRSPLYNVDVHQRYFRVVSNQPLINDARNKLEDILPSKNFNNFEELYKFIRGCNIKGFGPTTWYDFALRYGWHSRPCITPDEWVYVHSKPGLAANLLKEKGYIVTEITNPMRRTEFPDEIKNSRMNAADIEHFLCVYKKFIEQLPNKK